MSFSCESLIIFAFNFPEVSGVLKLYGWQGLMVSAQGILLWKIHEDSHLMAIKACTSNLSHLPPPIEQTKSVVARWH